MANLNPYLNFDGTAEAAFNLYKSVFGHDFSSINRMSDAPGADKIPEEERNRIMHISMPINEHVTLMGSDIIPSFGHTVAKGTSTQIYVSADSREDADRIFKTLSAGGKVEMPMEDTFWGAYFGSFQDKFGIYWMVSYDTGMASKHS